VNTLSAAQSGWRQRFWRTRPLDAPRVTLDHARIYILPTKRGLALGVTLLLMLLAALNYSASLGLLLVFLVAGAMAAALLHTFRNLVGLTLLRGGSASGFAGSDLEFRVGLAAEGHRPRFGLRLRADRHASTAALPRFEPGTPGGFSLSVLARRRGPLALGRLTLFSDYPLGLWHAWAYVHFDWTGLAYPKPEDGAPPAPVNAGLGELAGNGPGVEDFAGLRAFQPGDPLPHVAWKQAARGRGLLTKQYRGGGGADTFLRWSELPASMDTEARLSRLAAWALRAERSGRRYALELAGSTIPMGSGPAQLATVLAALARHPPLPRDTPR
jgi:uncharacterized protein (DUF58 family)